MFIIGSSTVMTYVQQQRTKDEMFVLRLHRLLCCSTSHANQFPSLMSLSRSSAQSPCVHAQSTIPVLNDAIVGKLLAVCCFVQPSMFDNATALTCDAEALHGQQHQNEHDWLDGLRNHVDTGVLVAAALALSLSCHKKRPVERRSTHNVTARRTCQCKKSMHKLQKRILQVKVRVRHFCYWRLMSQKMPVLLQNIYVLSLQHFIGTLGEAMGATTRCMSIHN
jgi:hypothetical protein